MKDQKEKPDQDQQIPDALGKDVKPVETGRPNEQDIHNGDDEITPRDADAPPEAGNGNDETIGIP